MRKIKSKIELRERMRKQKREDVKKYQDALEIINTLKVELDLYKRQESLLHAYKPKIIKPPPHSGGKSAVAFSISGDYHLEEEVTLARTNGMNESNPKIIKIRLDRYWDATVRLFEMCRRESPIDTLVVGILGDVITGYIHPSLERTNTMTPPQAIRKGFDFIISGLSYLLDHTDIKHIVVMFCVGNHGRITPKIDKKRPVEMNYEWIIYDFVARWFEERGEKRIEFHLPRGYFNYIEVLGRVVRFHHGNGFSYMGGVGGLQIPFKRARMYWNTSINADLDVFGHFHQADFGSKHICCNTIMGFSELFPWIRAEYSPPAGAFFLMHEKFGKTAQFPIVVDDDMSYSNKRTK